MEATLYPQEKKEIPWRLVVRIAVAVFAIAAVVLGGLLQSQANKRARAFETLSDIFVVRTGLEQYFLARSSYPEQRAASVPLGIGEAVCLGNSVAGFEFSCSGQVFVSVLPQSVDGSFYVYSKTPDGYQIGFTLPKSVGSLKDANKDGKIVCTATSSTITCQ